MTERIDVVYRGPFQSRRIRLILDTLEKLERPLHFTWIDPKKKAGAATPAFFENVLESRASLVGGDYLEGNIRSSPTMLRSLVRGRTGRTDTVVAIGFTSLYAARALRPRRLIWCINGIPEERLLYDDSRRSRAITSGLWRSAAVGPRPDVAITVSKPMSALVRSRVGVKHAFELPTAVDRAIFQPEAKQDPPLLNYTGSGAPWQNLDLLSDIWAEVARQHETARFLVVSRDERARVAIERLPADRAELVPGHGAEHVAELTAGATLGFVVRRPHVVNEVSFPTKFGEYVAAQTEVIATDIGWDLADLIRRTGCGRLVNWQDAPETIAEQIVHHLDSRSEADRAAACKNAADEMDRDRWITEVGAQLDHALA